MAAASPGPAAPLAGPDPAQRAQAAQPADAADDDLPAFCARAAPRLQVFEVRPGRDTVLVAEQGTRLVVPGRAFDVPAGSGPVRRELREFYSTPDILLAGLSTATGAELLETGGMLHLQATAAGQPVALRPGARVLLQLPAAQRRPGMQLYQGVAASGHGLDWQLPAGTPAARSTGRWVALPPPKGARWPRFDNGDATLLKEFERLVPPSATDLARLKRRRALSKFERQQLKGLSKENHVTVTHAILISLAVDSTGTVREPRLVQGDSVLGAKIMAAATQLPRQRPASFKSILLPHGRRTTSPAQGVLVVLYARGGKRLVGITWLEMEKHTQELLVQEARRARAEFAKQFAGAAPLTLAGGLGYELVAGGLGWINCDRLLAPGPRVQFAVQAPGPATVVSLVFQGQRSILASTRTEGNTAVFEQVPDGAAATIVALRRENGVTYLATRGVSLGQPAPPSLQFHPVTLEELRTELARL
ncbi:hypothetical protein [Hymenobacter caeli]|uniref:hypothetical protein n=1 Tax=Hymenobacter caeli TaxID=2735894 RepID=UPI0036D2DBEF